MFEYQKILRTLLTRGYRVEDPYGPDEWWGPAVHISVNTRYHFPLCSVVNIPWLGIVLETLWTLSGEKNARWLKDRGVEVDTDTSGYVYSAEGFYMRKLQTPLGPVDQLQDFVENSRLRAPVTQVVTAWESTNASVSPDSVHHTTLYFTCDRHAVNLHVAQNKVNLFDEFPRCLARYGLIQSILAKLCHKQPGTLTYTISCPFVMTAKSDNSLSEEDQLRIVKELTLRQPALLPRVYVDREIDLMYDLELLMEEDTYTILNHFKLVDYVPYPDPVV